MLPGLSSRPLRGDERRTLRPCVNVLYHSRVAAEYAALGVADEIEDCVAFLALWHLLLDQGYGLGDGATAVVEQAVDLLNELDGL